ncbi:PQQ-dependent sugar dehydrogenase [Peribacillus deserti]|uniref:Quinoprotein glucose dehydrogenase n=1 Tax=Peribacillus deserti TaxID=673318 RepID=A0A2N5M7B4_9BACI|nr:PQQ-dependent sugar dehydrogenase [Peribacillus deserti]PLT30268.1 quinoprotein glucose dehydrogenase [Peribacillus deserti]
MKRLFLAAAGGLLFLIASGCSGDSGNQQPAKEPRKPAETVNRPAANAEKAAERLSIPWSIEKTGNTFYISERTGTIAKVENGRTTRQKVTITAPLSTKPESGLLGFVLAPDFNTTKRAFAYYSYDKSGTTLNRVVILTLKGNQWNEERILIDNIPSGNFHHGGRLEIGPGQKLYITTGEGYVTERAQDLNSLGGKILRMNLDGSIPADNPFRGSYVYSSGHRNPQGLAWTEKGVLYSTEHGQSAHDEINLIKPGKNYGWPLIEGNRKRQGLETPVFHTGNDTWAPSGTAIYKGKIYIASLRGEAVKVFDPETGQADDFITGYGRIRDVRIEGGILYFVTNNTDGRGTPRKEDDQLYRVFLDRI